MSYSASSTGGKYISPNLNISIRGKGLADNNYNYSDRNIIRDASIGDVNSERSAQVSLVQPYITVYFWRRTA